MILIKIRRPITQYPLPDIKIQWTYYVECTSPDLPRHKCNRLYQAYSMYVAHCARMIQYLETFSNTLCYEVLPDDQCT